MRSRRMCPELSITASALLNAVLSAMKLRRSRTSAPDTGDAVVAIRMIECVRSMR